MDSTYVWKALADPNRRLLMDLVREGPKTTGELVHYFQEIGRCAVMKHLNVLQEANLIIAKKEGKFRWNYINAIPLQEMYERWVKKYEHQWAGNLIQLKQFAEHQSTNQPLKQPTMGNNISTINIELQIPISADKETVWKSLTEEIGTWWRKDFYTSEHTQQFILETKVGGRFYEDYGNDNGLLWATVIVLDAPNNIEFKGHLTPQFGGPAMSFLKLSLTEENGVTTLHLKDTVFGEISENTKENLTAGWKMLYEDTFKNYVENKSN